MTATDLICSTASDGDELDELTQNYRAALRWRKRGYNVVPRAASDRKHPAIKWKEYQDRAVTKDEILNWYAKFAGGLGFITGAISGVIVIESDGLAGETVLDHFEHVHGPLPKTLTIQSGSKRGFHRHFRHPGSMIKTTANTNIQIDIRADGGFCVLPPSRHKCGGLYEVVVEAEPAELPAGLLEFIGKKEAEAQNHLSLEGKSNTVAVAPSQLPDCEFRKNLSALSRPPPPAETMRAALKHLAAQNAFQHRNKTHKDGHGKITRLGWITTGMALKSAYGDELGFDLWAEAHIDDKARADAPAQWASFHTSAKAEDATIGSIIKASRDAGFDFQLPGIKLAATATPASPDSIGDVKNGQIFTTLFRNKLLFVHETKEWLLFDPIQGWIAAPPGEDMRAAKEALAAMLSHAAAEFKAAPGEEKTKKLMRHVERTSLARNLQAMIELAKSEPGMTAQLEEFDANPMLLGLTNGIFDLQSGILLPASPDILVSKRASVAYDPDATCPRFLKFMREVQPDGDIRDYLRRWAGYSLTGLSTEQVFNFYYGHGANGKTVFVEIIAWLLGDYSMKISTEMLMQHTRNPQSASPDIVGLKGIRFVYCSETEEGQRLSASRVKELTGSDTLVGRPLYGAPVTFQPTHKLVIVGNHKPEIGDISNGMWRRVSLVSFEVTIPEASRDTELEGKLKDEGSGILNWALDGLRDWLKNGLQIPDQVKAATAAYREEMDVVGEWIAECCTVGSGYSTKKDSIYASYQSWAEANGQRAMTQKRLTRQLGERSYKIAPDHRNILGIALKQPKLGGL